MSDLAAWIVDHRRLVILAFLIATAGMIAGAMQVEQQSSLDGFQTDSTESQALDRIQERYDRTGENVTTAQVVVEHDDVLGKAGLLETLRYQRSLGENETVAPTLATDDQPTTSVASTVATAAIRQEQRSQTGSSGTDDHSSDDASGASENESAAAPGSVAPPSLDVQIAQIESMSEAEVEATVQAALTEDRPELLMLLPEDYGVGETSADATMVLVRQDTRGEYVSIDTAPDHLIESQQVMDDLAAERDGAAYHVFGVGITADEFTASLNESLAIVGPFAFLFVLVVLAIAYRDPIDVVLGLGGIFLVLVWTFGFMGWAGIAFNQLFVAVPVLLIGLSIDYAIHVFMRSREARSARSTNPDDERSNRVPSSGEAMKAGLAGVGLALVLVTVTTAVGFLSNVVSPIQPIREFGIVNAAGIVAALFVFTLFVPAVKVEIDSWLERRGRDRSASAFGSSGRLNGVLSSASRIARRAPTIVIVLALLLSLGGAFGATQVDSSFENRDFLADDPPSWTESLPGSMQPSEYSAVESMDVLESEFVRQDLDAQVLVEGNVTDPTTLERIDAASQDLGDSTSTARLPNDRPAITGPTTTMRRVAAENESFNATLAASDTDGDGVPDRDVAAVYDALYAADPAAASAVVDRTDAGEYRSLRLTVLAAGSDETAALVDDVRDASSRIEGQREGTSAAGADASVDATATGQRTVLTQQVAADILDTVLWSLVVTLAAVGILLVVAYRVTAGRGSLGVVAMTPILMALSWVLGTMWLIGMPFNSMTGMITSLTIGIGVAYSIHVTERYNQELANHDSVAGALQATVTGTGGALLGSAATTAGGFGVLTFAFLPVLQQFGLITATSIGFAFLASVAVLPSLLVVWTRFLGPEWARTELAADSSTGFGRSEPGPGDD